MAELKAMGFDLDLTGFPQDELSKMLENGGGQTDPDAVPEPPKEAVTKKGDLWILGNHRLLCGDSTQLCDVERLMGGERARMCWTDPPFGVDYANHGNNKWGKHRPIANDNLDDAGMRQFWGDVLTLAATYTTGDLYVASPAGPPLTILDETVREDTPWDRHQWLVWVKQRLVLGRSNYHYRHEQILYGWLKGGKSSWSVGRDRDSVFEVDRPSVSEEHPTMKPVELVRRMIENSSVSGDIVYEPFSGSGTSILACEMLGRRCFAIELSETYVDVAITRWESFTGKKAVLVNSATL